MRKRILICHPDLEKEIRSAARPYRSLGDIGLSLDSIEVRANAYMEKYRKTGRYVLPDGSCVLPEDVTVSDRFIQYGYDDIWYLLWAGIITEEKKALFYIMDEPPDFLEELNLYSPKIFNSSAW